MKHLGFLVCFLFLFSLVQCTPLVYRPYKLPQVSYIYHYIIPNNKNQTLTILPLKLNTFNFVFIKIEITDFNNNEINKNKSDQT